MDEYHDKTNVRFVPIQTCASQFGGNSRVCGGCTQRMRIVDTTRGTSCFATLGYAPNQPMDLNFGPGCFSGDGGFSVVVHELGHIIGLVHEHTHPERQVIVLRDALTLSPDNYLKDHSAHTTSYDTGSVMHYGRETDLCVPRDHTQVYCDLDESAAVHGCVEPTVGMCDVSQDTAFGHAPTLSTADIATIARIYGSGATTPPPVAPEPSAASNTSDQPSILTISPDPTRLEPSLVPSPTFEPSTTSPSKTRTPPTYSPFTPVPQSTENQYATDPSPYQSTANTTEMAAEDADAPATVRPHCPP